MSDASVGVPMFQPSEPAVPFMQFNQGAYTTGGGGAYTQAPGQPAYSQSAYPPPSAYAPPPVYGGTFTAASTFGRAAASRFEDEPPLLEELGIDIPYILRKTKGVLNPIRLDPRLMDDGDIGGPLVFAFLLGTCQLLMGKVNFGYILGWSVVFMVVIHRIVSLIAPPSQGTEFYRVASLLGYCLLPIVLVSAVAVVLSRGPALYGMAVVAVLWSTRTASGLLARLTPGLEGQRLLVAYPCMLAYSMFAVLSLY